jgi:hypothetical protein
MASVWLNMHRSNKKMDAMTRCLAFYGQQQNGKFVAQQKEEFSYTTILKSML